MKKANYSVKTEDRQEKFFMTRFFAKLFARKMARKDTKIVLLSRIKN